jgi:hypothetical protein
VHEMEEIGEIGMEGEARVEEELVGGQDLEEKKEKIGIQFEWLI